MGYGQKKSRRIVPLIVTLLVGAGIGLWAVSTFLAEDTNEEAINSGKENKVPGLIEGVGPTMGLEERPLGTQTSFISRKSIHDRNMEVLAQSLGVAEVYIRPLELTSRSDTVMKLADLLELDIEKITADLKTERSFLWLKHNISADKALTLRAMDLKGVYLVNESKRYYPFKHHASHVIGFSEKGHGLAGTEYIYDSILRSEITATSPEASSLIESQKENLRNGAAPILSIDIDLQILLEAKLKLLLKKVDGNTGAAVVMDSNSGEVYAMASLPDFDPNEFWKAENYERKNRVVDETIAIGGLKQLFLIGAEIFSGNMFETDELEIEEIGPKILTPRKTKVIMGGRISGKLGWNKWGDDDYLAPEISWPKGFQAKKKKLKDFCKKLGISQSTMLSDKTSREISAVNRSTQICDLKSDTISSTLIALTNAFAQLANGGNSVKPSILHRLWLDKEDRLIEVEKEKSEKIMGEDIGKNIKAYLRSLNPHGSQEQIFIETLLSEKTENDDTSLENVLFKEEDKKVVTEEQTHETIGNITLIGGDLSGEKQLALGLSIAGAKVDTREKSPFRKFSYEILNKGRRILVKGQKNRQKTPQLLSSADSYKKWITREKVKSPFSPLANKEIKEGTMPSLTGLSLRKALQRINGLNLKVSLVGAGTVKKQSLKAGTTIKEQQVLLLHLSKDH